MSREQLSLGDEGIAEELAQGQRAISIAEFFEKNKQMLGFDSGARALVTAVKEGVDNSLDATEEAGILPDIYVEVEEVGDYYRVVIEDNGPGITKEQIPKVFGKLLYGSRFHVRQQKRGQQGIGISAAVLYSQLTSGKPVKITSRTMRGDSAQYFEVTIDTESNEPEIESEATTTWDRPHGTRIEMEMEANMRARKRLHDYIEYTAVVNPHARIEFREPKEHRKFERATDQLPDETEEIRPHPHGVELGVLQKMLDATDSYSVSGFLQGEFTRVGGKTARTVIDNYRDRHFGRGMAWRPPGAGRGFGQPASRPEESDTDADAVDTDIERAVANAVANKGKRATAAFAERVADRIRAADRIAHHEVVATVDDVAGEIESEFDSTFGTTVRENAVAAAWVAVSADRAGDLYTLIDEATTSRKDDAAVRGLAERIAAKFETAADAEEAGTGENGRDRVTRSQLREYIDRSADMLEEHGDATFGETARENVIEALWSTAKRVPDDPPKVRAIADDRDLAAALLEAMRETDILSPPTDCLSPITAELIEAGLRKEYDADFYAAASRDAEVHGGDPFVVEAGIAYGGEMEEDGQVDILRFANRVSLVYKRGACAITHVIKDINWRNYGLDQPGGTGIPNGPAVLLVHVASTNVPFTSESKDAVADIPEIEDEIELALREAARELKSYLNRRRSMEKRRHKRDQLATILPEMAEKLAEVTGRDRLDIDDSLARIMNNVLVDREFEDGTVRLTVENNTDANVDLELTDIVTAEPGKVNGASVVEMDGEWFVTWTPTVASGDEATLEYTVDGEPTFELSIDGVDDAKLTVAEE